MSLKNNEFGIRFAEASDAKRLQRAAFCGYRLKFRVKGGARNSLK